MNEKNIEKQVEELYQNILKRKADKTGLYYFISKIENEKFTIDDVKKILSESSEAHAIKNYSHYSDKYWNDLETVVKYKNKLSTNNENSHWLDDILIRFKEYLPFKNVLIVGCGNGWLERQLYEMKIGLHFDAFDISQKYIDEAKKLSQNMPIDYFIEDINTMSNIENKKYDAVFNFAILHHAAEIENATKRISEVLKPGGLIFNEEYVGPARNQYSDEHLQIMLEVMSDLPERFKSKHHLRPPLENFRVEPSEAIHSDLVIPMFKKYFDVVYERNMNGGIGYMLLWNNIKQFEIDDESLKWLEYILEEDAKFTTQGKIPVLFWYGVGKPKQ
jgi:2-polyprenyl-3-methyl-5-hydroxy-6-metoxy-1,4-benzoquinol methylase